MTDTTQDTFVEAPVDEGSAASALVREIGKQIRSLDALTAFDVVVGLRSRTWQLALDSGLQAIRDALPGADAIALVVEYAHGDDGTCFPDYQHCLVRVDGRTHNLPSGDALHDADHLLEDYGVEMAAGADEDAGTVLVKALAERIGASEEAVRDVAGIAQDLASVVGGFAMRALPPPGADWRAARAG